MGTIKTLIDNEVQLVDPLEMDHWKPIKPEGLSKDERRAGPETTEILTPNITMQPEEVAPLFSQHSTRFDLFQNSEILGV